MLKSQGSQATERLNKDINGKGRRKVVCAVPWRPEEGTGFPGSGHIEGCEPPCG